MAVALPHDFDPAVYLDLNEDLQVPGLDPVWHYLNHGFAERRAYKADMLALRPQVDDVYDSDGLRTVHNHDFLIDPGFRAAYDRGVLAAGHDYGWYWRVHMGLWAARTAARLTGDFVECGVNRGFLSSALLHDLKWTGQDASGRARTLWLLDTFAGLDPRYVSDAERAAGALDANQEKLQTGFYTGSFDAVRVNFASWNGVRIIQGSVPDTLPEVTAQQVAFLHIDMNCAPPEVAALDWFWPKMSQGGIVLFDDYAYRGFQPQKAALDIWASGHQVVIASLPTGQGLLIKT